MNTNKDNIYIYIYIYSFLCAIVYRALD